MDLIETAWNSITNLIFQTNKEAIPLSEATAAPYHSHPVEVELTVKPPVDVSTEAPPLIRKVFIKIFKPFPNEPGATEELEFPDTTTSGNLNEVNASTTEWLEAFRTGKPPTETATTNAYIIAALILVTLIVVCLGVIMWCKNNRLKAERRNEYPVWAVANAEYMDPKKLKATA